MLLQPAQDLDALTFAGLVDVDLLKAPRQRAVFLEVLTEFFVRGRPHAAQLAALQAGLEQVARIHRAARGGSGTDDGVDLVDEEHRVGLFLQRLQHGLDAVFEVAAVAGTRQQGAHIEREDFGIFEGVGYFAGHDLARQPFGEGGLADSRFAHKQRVVLATTTQHVNGAQDFFFAPHQRVESALFGFDAEVGAKRRERVAAAAVCVVVASPWTDAGLRFATGGFVV